jgi:DNA polymerase-1
MKILNSATLQPELLTYEEQLWAYNGLDTAITSEVFGKLKLQAKEAPFAYSMSRAMQGPAFTLSTRGVKIDDFRRREELKDLEGLKRRYEHIFARLTGEGIGREINYRSPLQLQVLFFQILGLKPTTKYNRETKTSKVTTGREALEKLQKEGKGKPFADLILALRDVDKKKQVLETKIRDGRMYCSYHVAGTLTGRWSSSSDVFDDGSNLQNITDKMRRMFVTDPGMKMAYIDLQQAESVVTSYLVLPWGDRYYQAVKSGDVHTYVTKAVWGTELPWTGDPKKDKALADGTTFYRSYSFRDMGKRGGHASNYGVTPLMLSINLKIPMGVAEAFAARYYREFPEIKEWHNWIKTELASTRRITTPFGRSCHFPGRHWDNDTIKSAIAYSPQSTIGDLLNLGFYRVWKKYDRIFDSSRHVEFLLQVHDAVVFQYPTELEMEIVPRVLKDLIVPIEINGRECVIGADAMVGFNWGKADESNNPYGLIKFNPAKPDARSQPSALNRLFC